MACPYCYNPQIVRGEGLVSLEEALNFLQSRQNRLDGVVLSGGECTLYPHLEALTCEIKRLGFQIKIDTNGSNPTLLERLIENEMIDYVALDYKAPLEKYEALVHYRHVERFEHSLELLIRSEIPFEVRTTLHNDLLSVEDINAVIQDLHVKGYRGTYYLQRYLHVEETMGNTMPPQNVFDRTKLSNLLPISFRN